MLSKAETAQYVLWIIGKDEFINSPYHDEDLKLIVETKDTAKEKRDPVVWEALATVAKNPNSINSPYHKEDMELIAKSGSNCLKRGYSLTELAIDEVSLKDKYHLENMQILAKYPKYGDILLQLMTNEVIINGKYYREEINALATSKDDSTAKALCYYIYNPKKTYMNDCGTNKSFFECFKTYKNDSKDLSFRDADIFENNLITEGWIYRYPYEDYQKEDNKQKQIEYNKIKGLPEYDYLNGLNFIANAPNLYNFLYTSLLMSKDFIYSKNKEIDLETLKSIQIETKSDKKLFLILYKLFKKQEFQQSEYHINDLKLIFEAKNNENREVMADIASNSDSIKSPNHEFDMEYAKAIDFDQIQKDEIIGNIMAYLIYSPTYINSKDHKYMLEQLKTCENVSDIIPLEENYLDKLENSLENSTTDIFGDSAIGMSDNASTEVKNPPKILSKIKKFFRK